MFWLCAQLLRLLRFVVVELPQRLTAMLTCVGLAVMLWLHRRHLSHRALTGGEVAETILRRNGVRTQLFYTPGGWLSDHYCPSEDAVVLSERVYHGCTIGALSIAAHEAGHALQANRLLSPWWPMQLWSPFGFLGLGLCFWAWLVGSILEDQRWLLAALTCFGAYLLYLLLQLICEADASRRAVRELLRHDLIDRAESRVARRVLCSALLTYIAVFAASLLALAVLTPNIRWSEAADHARPLLHTLRDQLPSLR